MTRSHTRRGLLALGTPVLLAGLLVLPACAGKRRHEVIVRTGPAPGQPAALVLAPAVLMHADQLQLAPDGITFRSRPYTPEHHEFPLKDPTETEEGLLDVFYANLYVGKIWHGGGYELLPEVGNQARSIGLTFSHQEDFAAQALQWTDSNLRAAFDARGVPYVTTDDPVDAALTVPRRVTIRGTTALSGEDNQNLPDYTLEPLALDPQALPSGLDGQHLVVPIIVHYYAHNGGWFVGQGNGTAAGARFRLLLVVHDIEDGRVVTFADISARHIQDYFYSPNDVELQDYLLEVEAKVSEQLEKGALY